MFTKKVPVAAGAIVGVKYKTVIDWDEVWFWIIVCVVTIGLLSHCSA